MRSLTFQFMWFVGVFATIFAKIISIQQYGKVGYKEKQMEAY